MNLQQKVNFNTAGFLLGQETSFVKVRHANPQNAKFKFFYTSFFVQTILVPNILGEVGLYSITILKTE